MIKQTILFTLICSVLGQEQSDLCRDAPCGRNQECVVKGANLISCICKEGYRQSAGPDCVRVFVPAGRLPAPAGRDRPDIVSKTNNDNDDEPSRFGSAGSRPRAVNPGLRDVTPRVIPTNNNNNNNNDFGPSRPNNNNNDFGSSRPNNNNYDDFGSSRPNKSNNNNNNNNFGPSRTRSDADLSLAGSVGAAVNIIRESENDGGRGKGQVSVPRNRQPGSSSIFSSAGEHDRERPQFERNPFQRPDDVPTVVSPENAQNIYPEECLIHEDCVDSQFCDATDNTCKDICDQPNVCGKLANCRPVLHRPLCYCEPDHTGNPYKECVKRPSRAGLRFKRR